MIESRRTFWSVAWIAASRSFEVTPCNSLRLTFSECPEAHGIVNHLDRVSCVASRALRDRQTRRHIVSQSVRMSHVLFSRLLLSCSSLLFVLVLFSSSCCVVIYSFFILPTISACSDRVSVPSISSVIVIFIQIECWKRH